MTSSRSVVFAEPVRIAIGTFGGNLKDVAAPDLGAAVIKAALERAGLKPEEVGTVAMGNVIQAGVKMNPRFQLDERCSASRPSSSGSTYRCLRGARLSVCHVALVSNWPVDAGVRSRPSALGNELRRVPAARRAKRR